MKATKELKKFLADTRLALALFRKVKEPEDKLNMLRCAEMYSRDARIEFQRMMKEARP